MLSCSLIYVFWITILRLPAWVPRGDSKALRTRKAALRADFNISPGKLPNPWRTDLQDARVEALVFHMESARGQNPGPNGGFEE